MPSYPAAWEPPLLTFRIGSLSPEEVEEFLRGDGASCTFPRLPKSRE